MINHVAINNEYKLLLECCEKLPNFDEINSLEDKEINWDYLFSSAYMHGVFPLIYKTLKYSEKFPDKQREIAKSINFNISRENMLISGEMFKILKILKSHDIQAIVIKGPVLSHIIHKDITTRQYGDLDILVKTSQMYKTVKILQDNEYKSQYDIEFLKNKVLLKVGKDFPVIHQKNNVLIELHWRLFTSRYIKKNSIDLFSESNINCIINKHSVETLEINTMLIYLLMHGSKHYWERIEWIVDIDRVVREYEKEINWVSLIRMAVDMDIEFMFYLGLGVSQELFKTPLEPSIDKHIKLEVSFKNALEIIVNEIYNDKIKITHSELVSLENINKTYMMKNKQKNFILNYLDTLFEVNELDIYIVNLPKYLYFLYYPIRFYRLFKQNILHIS